MLIYITTQQIVHCSQSKVHIAGSLLVHSPDRPRSLRLTTTTTVGVCEQLLAIDLLDQRQPQPSSSAASQNRGHNGGGGRKIATWFVVFDPHLEEFITMANRILERAKYRGKVTFLSSFFLFGSFGTRKFIDS
jgi:hypothetical protein